ncbi:MAG: protein-L-isoaspartate O-methyltransferase [Patescibacteria group bacterium]
MREFVQTLIENGVLKTSAIMKAFSAIHREDFLPSDMKNFATVDTALPIGWGQTISQPFVVAFMLEHLEPKEGERILDIGAGSGWTTALLAHIVGPKGKVLAIEIVPGLAEIGRNNVRKYNFIEKGVVEFICADGAKGCAQQAPFDRILASASLSKKKLPQAWKEQLKTGGKIVTPVGESIWVFTKKGEDDFAEEEFPGFVFVPFVTDHY